MVTVATAVPMRHRPVTRTVAALLAATAALVASTSALAAHLLVNVTPSMPRGLYWMHLGALPGRGDLVAFRVPPNVRGIVRERRYLPDSAWLLKPVAAVAGDNVCAMPASELVLVDGHAPARQRPKDSDGRPLPEDVRCGPLAPGEVYVLAPDPRSFDSRVFGPVPVPAIHATVTPLWTF